MSSITHSYTTGISNTKSESIPSRTYSIYLSALANARVRAAATPLERQLRELARRLTLAEFHQLRSQLEDCCDEILLNHLP